MQRIRLVTEAYDYVKSQDPDTRLTLTAFRTLVNEKEIPCFKIGRKTLVNLDHVDKYLNEGGTTLAREKVMPIRGVRPVAF